MRRCQLRNSDWLRSIAERAAGRFELETLGEHARMCLDLCPDQLKDRAVVRLRRSAAATGRTILIATTPTDGEMEAALQWAAGVRDILQDSEPADLYLFMDARCEPPRAARLEADDRFCRRFVTRTGDEPSTLLDRTFLAGLSEQSAGSAPSEPLQASLSALQDLPPDVATAWREALLGGSIKGDLAEALVAAYPLDEG